MVTESKPEVQGHRHAAHPPGRHRQGDRPRAVRRRHPPAGRAARAHEAQPARPRHHQEHRHVEGAGARRREGGRDRRTTSRPDGDVSKLPDAAQNILAGTKVLYRGHAVAAVAAINDHIAQEAVEADRGRVRGAAARPRRARGDAPGRADPARGAAHARARARARSRRTSSPRPSPRSATSRRASPSATSIVENEFSTKMVHQGYIEPQASTAIVERRRPAHDLDDARRARSRRARRCAQILGHPISKIKVDPDGDRRRLRRQDQRLPGAGRRAALARRPASP